MLDTGMASALVLTGEASCADRVAPSEVWSELHWEEEEDT
jgi:hypothetical protein